MADLSPTRALHGVLLICRTKTLGIVLVPAHDLCIQCTGQYSDGQAADVVHTTADRNSTDKQDRPDDCAVFYKVSNLHTSPLIKSMITTASN